MRQIARRLRDGALELIEVPDPRPGAGQVLVEVTASVISSGTERATMEAAQKSLLAKARARPDHARQVLERVMSEGPRATYAFVRQRLDELGPLGYSAAGVVLEAGAEVSGVRPGDRVAIGGGGFANHAELDVVPQLLCAGVPAGVSDRDAAFATLGSIALHGFRRADVQVGSRVAVIGLGLIGQLAVRIADAAGCSVIGVDLDRDLVELAGAGGADAMLRDEVGVAVEESADAVLICASSGSNDPIELAAKLARDRAPVVVVGAVPMQLPRAPFYDKELDLRLSRSYGPGRYDPEYELHGADYPIGYVRWTERRNMEAFLDLVAAGKLRPAELVTHEYDRTDAQRAYEALSSESPVAIMLTYGAPDRPRPTTRVVPAPVKRRRKASGGPRFGLVGAGTFATAYLIPGMLKAGFEPAIVASASGLSAESARQRFGFSAAAAGPDAVIEDESLDLLVVATPHATHAELTARALAAGHSVYVEKPLALSDEELTLVAGALEGAEGALFVGFNRRCAPLAQELRPLPGPKLMTYRVNAGRLAPDHWTHDLSRGGGRLKGEGCHFVDFLCDQVTADPLTVCATGFTSHKSLPTAATDNFTIQIRFSDGSAGTVNYAADAPNGPGKERFETSSPGAYGLIDDWKTGGVWTAQGRRSLGGRTQNKGFAEHFQLMHDVVSGKRPSPAVDSYVLSTLATLAAARSLETGIPEAVVRADSPASPS